jgi:hypothetical protein
VPSSNYPGGTLRIGGSGHQERHRSGLGLKTGEGLGWFVFHDIDASLEVGTVLDHDALRRDVAYHARILADLYLFIGIDFTLNIAEDLP